MLRSTPRIEVNQRSREARLRLERVERLIAVVMTTRSLLVPRTGGLAAKGRDMHVSGQAVTIAPTRTLLERGRPPS